MESVWMISGNLMFVIGTGLCFAMLAEKRKYEKEFHKTFSGAWKLLEHNRTELQEEEWYNHLTLEMKLNKEIKIKMSNEVFSFRKVELYQKIKGRFVLIETVVDNRLEGGNAWLNLKGQWANKVYLLLEKKHAEKNNLNKLKTEGDL